VSASSDPDQITRTKIFLSVYRSDLSSLNLHLTLGLNNLPLFDDDKTNYTSNYQLTENQSKIGLASCDPLNILGSFQSDMKYQQENQALYNLFVYIEKRNITR
jgi:hypothetical protein